MNLQQQQQQIKRLYDIKSALTKLIHVSASFAVSSTFDTGQTQGAPGEVHHPV